MIYDPKLRTYSAYFIPFPYVMTFVLKYLVFLVITIMVCIVKNLLHNMIGDKKINREYIKIPGFGKYLNKRSIHKPQCVVTKVSPVVIFYICCVV